MSATDSPEPDATFPDVLDAARNGEGRALRQLYEQLAGPVAGYLRSRGAVDPEGATNEVFHRAFRRLRSFTGDAASFRSWIFAIAHNLLVDERRKAARRPWSRLVGDRTRLETPGGDVESEAMAQLELGTVAEVLSGLSEAQRDVLYLRVVVGLSVAETAEALARTPGAVKALQHRGLTALRTALGARRVTETG